VIEETKPTTEQKQDTVQSTTTADHLQDRLDEIKKEFLGEDDDDEDVGEVELEDIKAETVMSENDAPQNTGFAYIAFDWQLIQVPF
jgi:hypothetical protein